MKAIFFILLFIFLSFSGKSAELFIKIAKPGLHSAVVHNQSQSNTTNVFRFFDLPGGTMNVQIIDQQTGAFLYNSSIYLNVNQHIAAEIDLQGNFIIIQDILVYPSNWYTSVYSTTTTPPISISNQGYTTGMTPPNSNDFNQFLLLLDKEGFDSGKLSKSKSYIDKCNLTTQQITEISKKISFDSNRLEWSKYAYPKCVDKQNYFMLKNTFVFSLNYSELEKYIDAQ